jgi:hypothetical protein
MAAEKPSYMLVPNWDFPPDGHITLGNVLKNPKRPDRALHKGVVDETLVTTTKREGWSYSPGNSRSCHVGLWASFLAPILGVGADVDASLSRDSNAVYKCEELETRYFAPEDAFIASCLGSATVKAYTENNWWKSIYMITGVKIAHGATMESTVKDGGWFDMKVGVDGTPSGVPVGGGPKGGYKQEIRKSVKFGAKEAFVIAYRLLKIKPKQGGSFKGTDFNKFALLGEGDNYNDLEREQAVKYLHQAWEIEELKQPTDDEEWEDIQLATSDDVDCNLLIEKPAEH